MEKGWKPWEIRELTMTQFRYECEGVEKTSERSRYRQMSDEVKAKAAELQRKQGSF